jgi:D-amino-acid oxidase
MKRREWLRTTALLTAGTMVPAAAAETQLRGGEILPDPSFDLLHKDRAHWIGIRPHRRGGARLEVEAVQTTASGDKYLAHNYGHGGCGITLSWGCASHMVELLKPIIERMGVAGSQVAVIGSGVIGLTTATELMRAWPKLAVTVYAKSLDVSTTTSFGAGGQFEPSVLCREYRGRKDVLAGLLRASRDRIVGIQRSGERHRFGVAERINYTLAHPIEALDDFTPRDVIAAPQRGRLPFYKLTSSGRAYQTWLMNPMKLLPTLAADLRTAGVPFIERTFLHRDEWMQLPHNIIINCTGFGAKQLVSDDAVIGQRGHLVRLQKTNGKQHYFFSGGCDNRVISYTFCRQDDVVIGGTLTSGVDDDGITPADDATFARILDNARLLFGGAPAACLR